MLKKTLFLLMLVLTSYGKLFAQSYNPPIHVPDLPCSYKICLIALDQCRQIACGAPKCVTVPPHSPGIYYANPISGCLNGLRWGCIAWNVSFEVGPCEVIPSDAPTQFIVNQGTATGWTTIGTGQNYSFMWDGSSIYIQP